MSRSIQQPLPPMAVEPVDRGPVARTTAVDRWLSLMRQAIEDCKWKHEALAESMGIDKAYLSRLLSGEKPWRVEHVVSLPDDVEAKFEALRAESFGLIVVPRLSGDAAIHALAAGLFGILQNQKVA